MNNIEFNIDDLKFNENGLIPCICQDYFTNEVLMLAYMNKESIELTLKTKHVHYFSRSRQKLWKKGETSGNIQELKGFYFDCDNDTILIKVKQTGVACHTGSFSCFFNTIFEDFKASEGDKDSIIEKLYAKIVDRKENPKEDSYTNYLFNKGIDKILKKVGEESAEVIIASKNNSKDELIYESSDLVYHMLVLLINQGLSLDDIKKELEKRFK